MTWTAAHSPLRFSPRARQIKLSESTPPKTSPSSHSHRSRATAMGSTAAASAPVASTWHPVPPTPPRWYGRWAAGRSRPCSSIRVGVRSGCVPSHPPPRIWFRALQTAPWLCGTSRPELCSGQCYCSRPVRAKVYNPIVMAGGKNYNFNTENRNP